MSYMSDIQIEEQAERYVNMNRYVPFQDWIDSKDFSQEDTKRIREAVSRLRKN